MPPRRRPTARLLTPIGWFGAIALLVVVGGLVVTVVWPREGASIAARH